MLGTEAWNMVAAWWSPCASSAVVCLSLGAAIFSQSSPEPAGLGRCCERVGRHRVVQKRFIRIISLSTYNAHTEPWFKHFEILKINNLFDLNCLKFIYNFNKRELPNYFLNFRYEQRSSIHDHDTRFADLIDAEPTRTVMAENCIRHHIVTLLNCTPSCILDKIATHSLQGFTFYIKRYYLNQMSYECSLRQCYVCNMQSRWWPWPDNDFTETR